MGFRLGFADLQVVGEGLQVRVRRKDQRLGPIQSLGAGSARSRGGFAGESFVRMLFLRPGKII